MIDELAKDSLEMTLAERNDPIQAFPADGSDQPLAKCIRLRRSSRRFQDADPETAHGAVRGSGKDRVAIVDQESVGMIESEELSELLDRPFGGRMLGHILMQDSARTDFNRDKYVNDPEGGGDGNKEVAGDNGLRVIPNEGRPALVSCATGPVGCEIFANRSRRDANPQLQREFIRNLFLAPGRILMPHLPDQFAQVLGHRRSSRSSRLPTPERSKASAMPFDKGFRLNDHKRVSPIEEPAETNHDEAKSSGRSPRSDLTFLEQRKLLSEKKILRDEGDPGAQEQAEEGQQLRILQDVPRQIEFLRSSRFGNKRTSERG